MTNIAATSMWNLSEKNRTVSASTQAVPYLDPKEPIMIDTLQQCEYVNAVVFDVEGNALVFKLENKSPRSEQWHMIEATVSEIEDPLTAVQNALLQQTGYTTPNWRYIGTFLRGQQGDDGVGHIFVARAAKKNAEPSLDSTDQSHARWIPIEELKHGLLDGRIHSFRYALNAALALLMHS